MKRLLLATLACVVCVSTGGAQTGRMDLDAFGRIVRLSDPQIAPDGTSIVLVVSRANFEDNRYDADLVQVEVASGARRTLTNRRRGLGQPRWSPSGDRLAFLAQAPGASGGDPKPQVFVLAMNGGDARRVTNAPNGVEHYAWSPDGMQIAFAAADEPQKVEGVERHNRSFEIENDDFLVQAAPRPTHIWVVRADGADTKRVTSGTWSLPTSFPPGPPASPLSWSPDGTAIAFTRVPSPHSGDFDRAQIQVVEAASEPRARPHRPQQVRGTSRVLAGRFADCLLAPERSGAERHQRDSCRTVCWRRGPEHHGVDRSAHGARALVPRRQIAARRRQS